MNLGVLLLYCEDNPRVTAFTRDWAEVAVQSVADYVLAQSGGRESVSFEVFEWHELQMTSTQWGDLGMAAGPAVRPQVATEMGVDLGALHAHFDWDRHSRRQRWHDAWRIHIPRRAKLHPLLDLPRASGTASAP